MMGIVTDRTAIQFRMLNRSKGPAMWSPRAQSDRMRFSEVWRHILENTENLSLWQDSVTELIFEDGADDADSAKVADIVNLADREEPKLSRPRVVGVKTALGATFSAKAVVLTNGTFLNGLMHVGRTMIEGGRCAEAASHGISEQLRELGFEVGRMKTGTPVRIDGRSVDWTQTIPQELEEDFHHFSYLPEVKRELCQRRCYNVFTSEETHDILREGLPDSPLYNGQIQSIGPRY